MNMTTFLPLRLVLADSAACASALRANSMAGGTAAVCNNSRRVTPWAPGRSLILVPSIVELAERRSAQPRVILSPVHGVSTRAMWLSHPQCGMYGNARNCAEVHPVEARSREPGSAASGRARTSARSGCRVRSHR